MNPFDDDVRAAASQRESERDGGRLLVPEPKPPYDIANWRITRFRGPAPEMAWLVRDLIPMGTAGAMYSVGGVGKSSLALDLAVRVAIAPEIPNEWLGAYPIDHGGAVAYLSCEEPESVLHKRFGETCEAIADMTSTSFEQVFETASKNLYLANLQGQVEPLFNIKATTLDPSDEYARVKAALQQVAQQADLNGISLRLVVLDTRSRFSGVEGAGNALVAREVNYYEGLVREFGASLLILHHVTKHSLNGGNAMAASRGESSFLDSLRFSIHLESMPSYTASKNGISEKDRSDYLVLSNSKQNYGKVQGPIVVRRKEFKFVKVEVEAKDLRADKKQRQGEEDREKVLAQIRFAPGRIQQDVIHALRQTMSQARCRRALEDLERLGLLRVKHGGNQGRKEYSVLEEDVKGDVN